MVQPSLPSWFSIKANQGGPEHLAARDRVIKLLESIGFRCETEQKFYAASDKGLLPYEPDILVTKDNLTVVVEFNGKSHWGRIPRSKDKFRKKWFKETLGFPTVVYEVTDLVGKKKADDATILKQFWWGINN